MLSNTLNTNEVKNAAGAEVEFNHLSNSERARVFYQIGEAPALTHRLLINHQEIGSGLTKRRRSRVGFTKTVISTVDNVTPVTILVYKVVDAPIGALLASSEIANVLAESMSFEASLGASTTILYDCTGNGAACLLNGSL
jgi:hypothetical protein